MGLIGHLRQICLDSLLGQHSAEVARDFYYATEQEWLDVQWSHEAVWLEALLPAVLSDVSADAFERLHVMRSPEGIPQHQVALIALAKKAE